jgi:hypothetical protein
MKALDEILRDAHNEATLLRANGAGMSPDRVMALVKDVANATVDMRVWLTFRKASIRSGRPERYWSRQFPELLGRGLARFNPERPREKQVLQVAVPQRANPEAAREAGRRAVGG